MYSICMKLPCNTTVLFVSPHPDDETIAAGGLLHTLSQNNNVHILFLADGPRGVEGMASTEQKIAIRQAEAKQACDVLRAKAYFLSLDKPALANNKTNLMLVSDSIMSHKPGLVITLNPDEAHPTHQIASQLVMAALAMTTTPLWYGEVWSPIANPDFYHHFDEAGMAKKLQALQLYKSQMVRTDWITAVRALNTYRALTAAETSGAFGAGAHIGLHYAEAYKVAKF